MSKALSRSSTSIEKEDVRKLVRSINNLLESSGLSDARLDHVFDRFWPEFEEGVKKAIEAGDGEDAAAVPARSRDAILSEILDLTRTVSRSVAEFTNPDAQPTRSRHNFRTAIAIVPTRDSERVHNYTTACAADPEVRKCGVVSYGSGGIGTQDGGTEQNNIHFQSYHPVPKEPLFRIAREMGIEIIDIVYERIVFKRAD